LSTRPSGKLTNHSHQERVPRYQQPQAPPRTPCVSNAEDPRVQRRGLACPTQGTGVSNRGEPRVQRRGLACPTERPGVFPTFRPAEVNAHVGRPPNRWVEAGSGGLDSRASRLDTQLGVGLVGPTGWARGSSRLGSRGVRSGLGGVRGRLTGGGVRVGVLRSRAGGRRWLRRAPGRGGGPLGWGGAGCTGSRR
jgi:hypothetical protein